MSSSVQDIISTSPAKALFGSVPPPYATVNETGTSTAADLPLTSDLVAPDPPTNLILK